MKVEVSSRRAGVEALLLALAMFCLYLVTLHEGLTAGDAPELVLAAWAGGVAHPPGYPLYTWLLAAAIRVMPDLAPIAIGHAFSALASAAASGVLYLAALRLTGSRTAALVGGLSFALGPEVWRWSTETEVFAANLFLAALALWAVLAWRQEARPLAAGLLGALPGWALAHHHTLALWLVLLLPIAVVHAPRRFLPRAALGLPWGVLPLAYLPWASAHPSLWSFGGADTVDGFLSFLLRRDYGTFRLFAERDEAQLLSFGERLAHLSESAWNHLGPVGLGLIVAGVTVRFASATVAARGPRTSTLAWVAALLPGAFYSLVFVLLANPSRSPLELAALERFWLLTHLSLSIAVALCVAVILLRLDARRATPTIAPRAVLVVAMVIAPSFAAARRAPPNVFEDYGRAILRSVSPGGVLLLRGDLPSNVVRYLHAIEGVRSDVIVLDQELLTRVWYTKAAKAAHPTLQLPGERYHPLEGFDLLALLEANPGKPVHVYPQVKPFDVRWRERAQRVPVGMSLMLVATDAKVDRARIEPPALPAENREHPIVGLGAWELAVHDDTCAALARHGGFWLERALARRPPELGPLERARELLDAAVSCWPLNRAPWPALKNLGLAEYHATQLSGAAPARAIRILQLYLERAPASDPGRDAIEHYLRAR